jgi:hypothetical protein
MVAGCRLQVAGCRLQVAGCRLQVAGCRLCVLALALLMVVLLHGERGCVKVAREESSLLSSLFFLTLQVDDSD